MVKVKSRRDKRNRPGAYERWFNEECNDEKNVKCYEVIQLCK
jgi:hypothetical protein